MMSSFTPCANAITGSTNNNGLVLSNTCCDSLRSLMTTNMECACQAMSPGATFLQQPINQLLALSLSRACNINGLALQCKAFGSPLPAPGPVAFGPKGSTPPSIATSPLSPQGVTLGSMDRKASCQDPPLPIHPLSLHNP
ncbi:hypothetical protein RJT34_20084 [Clitoria ternatea]|uniref:Bifunctional inhibitor/plant lipid transfer protein/seed storage helical domain-containing protein n=1 Tax=Clitoria ternatea TaxID=43366 RepID=A0AAN9P4P6_CLITE